MLKKAATINEQTDKQDYYVKLLHGKVCHTVGREALNHSQIWEAIKDKSRTHLNYIRKKN